MCAAAATWIAADLIQAALSGPPAGFANLDTVAINFSPLGVGFCEDPLLSLVLLVRDSSVQKRGFVDGNLQMEIYGWRLLGWRLIESYRWRAAMDSF